MRYFFDIMSPGRCKLDSFGTLFADQEEAYKWAQLLIVVLQSARDSHEIESGRVRVRGSDQRELFSIPIGPAEANPAAPTNQRVEPREDHMKSLVAKRSIIIGGRKSSVSLEEAFWKGLKDIASSCRLTLAELVGNIDSRRQHRNLSSAIRLFVLDHYRRKLGPDSSAQGAGERPDAASAIGSDGLRSTESLYRG